MMIESNHYIENEVNCVVLKTNYGLIKFKLIQQKECENSVYFEIINKLESLKNKDLNCEIIRAQNGFLFNFLRMYNSNEIQVSGLGHDKSFLNLNQMGTLYYDIRSEDYDFLINFDLINENQNYILGIGQLSEMESFLTCVHINEAISKKIT